MGAVGAVAALLAAVWLASTRSARAESVSIVLVRSVASLFVASSGVTKPPVSVPAGLDAQGLPLGLQLIGRPFDEQGVLNAGLAIEERARFAGKPEKWW